MQNEKTGFHMEPVDDAGVTGVAIGGGFYEEASDAQLRKANEAAGGGETRAEFEADRFGQTGDDLAERAVGDSYKLQNHGLQDGPMNPTSSGPDRGYQTRAGLEREIEEHKKKHGSNRPKGVRANPKPSKASDRHSAQLAPLGEQQSKAAVAPDKLDGKEDETFPDVAPLTGGVGERAKLIWGARIELAEHELKSALAELLELKATGVAFPSARVNALTRLGRHVKRAGVEIANLGEDAKSVQSNPSFFKSPNRDV